jgi:hypothetical protein
MIEGPGQIAERGTQDELLTAGGVHAGLYRTQFASQAALRSFSALLMPDANDELAGGGAVPMHRAMNRQTGAKCLWSAPSRSGRSWVEPDLRFSSIATV